MSHEILKTYLYEKIICCLSEIQMLVGVQYVVPNFWGT